MSASLMEARKNRHFSIGQEKMQCRTAWVLLSLKTKPSKKKFLVPTQWKSILESKLKRKEQEAVLQ